MDVGTGLGLVLGAALGALHGAGLGLVLGAPEGLILGSLLGIILCNEILTNNRQTKRVVATLKQYRGMLAGGVA